MAKAGNGSYDMAGMVYRIYILAAVLLLAFSSLADADYDLSRNKRYHIIQVNLTSLSFRDLSYREDVIFPVKYFTYAAEIVFHVKQVYPMERLHQPDVIKIYLYDKSRNLVKVLRHYYIRMGVDYTDDYFFHDFQVNKTYRLDFLIDYKTRMKTRYVIAVVGDENGDNAARLWPGGNIRYFDFEENPYFTLKK
jgi:hypothetical protein